MYEELPQMEEEPVSLNRTRRPPSLSDSYILMPQNVERARSFRLQHLPVQPPMDWKTNMGLKFLFHILLIAIFETIFFFHYVSALEDSGSMATFDSLTNTLAQTCSNLTYAERDFVNTYFGPYVNNSIIDQQASVTLLERLATNRTLLIKSWIYVGAFASIFAGWWGFTFVKRNPIMYKTVCLETLGLVTVLGLYEIMFFTTIILPYQPISSQEVLKKIVTNIQTTCRVF